MSDRHEHAIDRQTIAVGGAQPRATDLALGVEHLANEMAGTFVDSACPGPFMVALTMRLSSLMTH